MKQNPFKVGDKVRCYISDDTIDGIVDNIDTSRDLLKVERPNRMGFYLLHWKQCRRLVKKKRKEYWFKVLSKTPVVQSDGSTFNTYAAHMEDKEPIFPKEWVHVREVPKK